MLREADVTKTTRSKLIDTLVLMRRAEWDADPHSQPPQRPEASVGDDATQFPTVQALVALPDFLGIATMMWRYQHDMSEGERFTLHGSRDDGSAGDNDPGDVHERTMELESSEPMDLTIDSASTIGHVDEDDVDEDDD